ncbi:mutator type transposase [Tanacetum coccineum]|uniref:Mutator type transposase n=1 Tax=Tanacetum coccineum TaxID=301880 RepID=A0ABQ4ZYH0_9ASTR
MAKYVTDNKIILVYVEHESSNVDSSIFVTHKKGVAIAVDNHLRKAPIEIDSSPDMNRNLTPMFEGVDDPFKDLDEILGDYANNGKQITRDEITGKQMVVHVGNSFTVDDVLDLHMLFETEGVGPIGKFKEVEDLDYDPKHDEVFDDDEHIVKDVPVIMNNLNFTADLKHDLSIAFGKLLKEIHVTWTQFGKTRDEIATLHQNRRRKAIQWLETASQFLATTSRRSSNGVRTLATAEILGLDGCFMSGLWPGQILTAVGVDANNRIYPVAYVIVEAESKASWCWFLNLLGEDLGIEANFNYTFILIGKRQLVDGRDQPIITCLEYIKEYLMKRIVVVQKVIAKTVGPLTPYVTAVFDAIKKLLSTLFNEIEEVGAGWNTMPPKKRKKSHDEIARESCSTSKLSRKRKAVKCSKCRNLSHNRKGCRGQVGGSSQDGARQVIDARNVSGQAGARQAVDARNVSGQAGARQAAGARNVSGQASGIRNTSSQVGGFS